MELFRFWFRAALQHQIRRIFSVPMKCLRIAADHGMVVLLDPIETISWLGILRKNGTSKAFEYGQYLGNRYKDFPNIIWMHGNDFQSWRNAADDALVQAVPWAPLIELNAAYTYFPTYAQVLTEYNPLHEKAS
jgi:Protein of unknown function (DUF4038)